MLDNSKDEVLIQTATLLGFQTENTPNRKKLAAKISDFLRHPDSALCDADNRSLPPRTTTNVPDQNEVPPRLQTRKRRSAPAAATARKAKAARGRRGASAAEPASTKDESAAQTVSVSSDMVGRGQCQTYSQHRSLAILHVLPCPVVNHHTRQAGHPGISDHAISLSQHAR